MHTASGLSCEMFSVSIDGNPAGRHELLDWGMQDRLGVVMSAPYGALGAALLIQLTITAFYDVADRTRRQQPIYPEIYLFHVGGRWGSHSGLDFLPDRKEIFLPNDATEVLCALNDRGITHLAVPEANAQLGVMHRFKEPEIARDRIKQCFIYDARGSARQADVTITSSADQVLNNIEGCLYPERLAEAMDKLILEDKSFRSGTAAGDDMKRGVTLLHSRIAEVARETASYREAATRLNAARLNGQLVEAVRRIGVDEAMGRLVRSDGTVPN